MVITKPYGVDVIIVNLESCQITPEDIAYLCDILDKSKIKYKAIKARGNENIRLTDGKGKSNFEQGLLRVALVRGSIY